jgi:bifunctional non-homologous end joining protein LigD
MLPGAKPGPFPGFIEPAIPTLRSTVPTGGGWLHEIKFDGYRVQLHLSGGRPAILTPGGYDWTGRFAMIAAALKQWPVNDLILDGEVIVSDERGIARFSDLQADLAAGRKERMICYLFDLLHLDGFDLRVAPLIERKRVLRELAASAPTGRLLFSDHLESDGPAFYKHACAMGLEGLVCKRTEAPYRSGRTETLAQCQMHDARGAADRRVRPGHRTSDRRAPPRPPKGAAPGICRKGRYRLYGEDRSRAARAARCTHNR